MTVWGGAWREVVRFAKSSPEPASPELVAAFDRAVVGLASIAAIAAYTFQPVQRFADNEGFFLGGMFLIMGLLPTIVRRGAPPRFVLWFNALFIVFAGLMLFKVGDAAVARSEWNDRRCLRIQKAMLRPTTATRDDLPDLFTALGCRPQEGEPFDPGKKYRAAPNGPPPTETAIRAHAEFLDRALANEVALTNAM